MNYLTAENITKTYGEKVLFQDVSFHINKGQKVALVARNGAGKSTLLRVLSGQELPEGERAKWSLRRDVRVGILQQDPEFFGAETVLEAVLDANNPLLAAIREYEAALLLPDETVRFEAALARMEDLKAWDIEARVKEILFKLNIQRLDESIGVLSGGQKKRVALARLIIEEPDFLILDEPTNHLDLEMIEWLEEYLRQPNLTILMVTHDRYFLDRVCDTIVELDNGKLYRYKGNYADFLESKASREEVNERTLERDKKLFRKELEWVRRMPKARGTKAKARVEKFEQIKEKVSGKRLQEEVQIEIKGSRLGSKILELHSICKSYGDHILVDNFFYKFRKKERVGIVGPNGAGKTTFLKMLTREIRPDHGKVVVGGTVQFGYFTQDGIDLKEDKRVIEVVRDVAEFIPLEKGQKLTAPQLLDRFLFTGGQQQVFVSQLSGGERRRLHLLTILMSNPNFLILDEPTNDLDIITLNVLEDFLMDFPGCLIIVSHDRYFMDKIVDHLFIFEGNGKIRDYNGKYTEYREQKREDEIIRKREETGSRENTSNGVPVAERKEKRKRSYHEQVEFERLESEIEALEDRKAAIFERFNLPDLPSEEIEQLSREVAEVTRSLEEKELRWMELGEIG